MIDERERDQIAAILDVIAKDEAASDLADPSGLHETQAPCFAFL
jgi:hypothetical protein